MSDKQTPILSEETTPVMAEQNLPVVSEQKSEPLPLWKRELLVPKSERAQKQRERNRQENLKRFHEIDAQRPDHLKHFNQADIGEILKPLPGQRGYKKKREDEAMGFKGGKTARPEASVAETAENDTTTTRKPEKKKVLTKHGDAKKE